MKKMFVILALALPLCAQAASTTAKTTATTATKTTTPSAPAGTSAIGMLAQLPAFLTRIDTLRGKALTVAEKATVTDAVTQGNTTATGIQSKFLGGVSKATGLDATTLGAIVPGATQGISTPDLTSKIESKLGKKLGFMQSAGVKTANALRNNSLDGLKTTLSDGIAKKIGMDPATIAGLLPMLGF
ncbi:MAG: hypothetical protein PSX71_07360 [bacterium]|nr:hypothetical protein [bacterium]